jgi:hypothetical protein
MASKKCQLPVEFGVFTRFPPHHIEAIQKVSHALVKAYESQDHAAWSAIIATANKTLTKNERGMFSAFAIMMVKK